MIIIGLLLSSHDACPYMLLFRYRVQPPAMTLLSLRRALSEGKGEATIKRIPDGTWNIRK